MTTTALAEGYRVHQAVLGAKVHDPKDPAASLGPMFRQVVGTLFGLMARYAHRWWAVRGSEPAQRRGSAAPVEPEPVAVSLEALVGQFQRGLESYGPLWRDVLAPLTYQAVADLAAQPPAGFTFPAEPWVHVVYDFAVPYCGALGSAARVGQILDALTPLYFGPTAGLVVDTLPMDEAAFEGFLEAQAHVFEREKPYLLERWDAAAPGSTGPGGGGSTRG